MARVLVVDEAFADQVFDLLSVAGGRSVRAQALDSGALPVAPTWAQVLIAGNDSGGTNAVMSFGDHLRLEGQFGAGTGGEIFSDGGQLFRILGDDGALNGVTTLVQGGDGGTGLGGNVTMRPGAGGTAEGSVRMETAAGTVIFSVARVSGSSRISFFGAAFQSRQTITGSRGGNAALASLLTALASYGLIIDSTTA